MDVPLLVVYWLEDVLLEVLPCAETMLPPGAVISGFIKREPGMPQELKLEIDALLRLPFEPTLSAEATHKLLIKVPGAPPVCRLTSSRYSPLEPNGLDILVVMA